MPFVLVYLLWWLDVSSYQREDAKRLDEAGGLFLWGLYQL
jgi:hypothetical protein